MTLPLGYTLLHVLKKGTDRLSKDSLDLIRAYVHSQMTDNDTFINRGGKEDLYYTMFGWMLCHTLHIKVNKEKRKSFLKSIDEERLDSLHNNVYHQCLLLDELLNSGIIIATVRQWHKRHTVEEFFSQFIEHGNGRTLSTIAATLLVSAVSQKEKRAMLQYMLSMQDSTGGFLANEGADLPDLLSTAVALFTLRTCGVTPSYPVGDFLEVHMGDDGSFLPNLLDTEGDVEYSFYGLLALGSM